MADSGSGEKSEQPTGKKLSDARSKGNVSKSPDLSSAISLLIGFLLLYAFGRTMYNKLFSIMQYNMGNLYYEDITPNVISDLIVSHMYIVATMLFPVAGGLLMINLTVQYLQTGFLFNLKLLKPDLKKLDLIQGAKKLVSVKQLVKLAFSIGKLIVIVGVAYFYLNKELEGFLSVIEYDLAQTLIKLTKMSYGLILRMSVALLVLAILDTVYQKWQYKRSLKMTKHEVKEERKQADGDPKIKARIRQIQLRMALKRMAAAVPAADVVVTNPTHYAVALKYDNQSMAAPKVVAKGADYLARRIKDIAKKHNVPIVEDKPLAQTLYKTVEIDREVPQKFYYAIAKILSYVYQLKKR
ncbi:MAG: flagellar biosynthesis protein FlhB [Candidatus Brocadiaceae bacterium]|nr:flagellar biosynthesis protein FlhB [Candidatus Brocadiaceae bacterium]